MKKCLIILLFLWVKSAFGQLNDNFEDGDLSNNPVWSGSNSSNDFTITGDPNPNQLQSNSITISSNFYLSTPNTMSANCTWEFWCNLAFNPSSANYVDVYLISDQQNLQSANINGYFVRIGYTADEIALYKRTGATNTSVKIIDGIDGVLNTSNNTIKIRVSRNAANQFTLERDLSGIGFDYFPEGSVTDNNITTTSYFGILIQQSTAAFIQKHFFDNFKIEAIVADTTPPILLSAAAIDSNTLSIIYNEPMDSLIAKSTANYQINNAIGNPVSIKKTTNSAHYELKLANNLNTGTYFLTANNVTDKAGNVIANSNSASFDYVKPYIPQANDILINEIFADPSPQIDLPALEFIELWNTSAFPISLNKWTYSDAGTTYTFGNETLQANEYAIICALEDVANFTTYGKVIGISPWPSLNNASDQLKLKNENGTLMNQVNYADTWYKDDIKKQGGHSLELINPKALCSGIQNWSASTNIGGGTPGKVNAIYEANAPQEPLKLISAQLLDSVTLAVHYNRYVDSTSAAFAGHYELNNGVGQPVSAIAIGPAFSEVNLKFATPLALGMNYTLSASQVSDCSGILLAAPNNITDFFLAEHIQKGDILINEVLFNPRLGGADFVELYNNSDHPLDLKDLEIGSIDQNDQVINLKNMSSTTLLIPAKSYRALSTSTDNILAEYTVPTPANLIKVSSLPAFNDDSGSVVLISNNARIDQLNYTEQMHFPLIKNPEGVSLERSSFSRLANEAGNFRSAAASVGFATPGYQNSQFIIDNPSGDEIKLTSSTFSPDQDGFEDVLTINYSFAQPGLVSNVRIYSDKGLLIRNIAANQTLASTGAWIWDGLNDDNEIVPIGIYLVRVSIFNLNGKVKTFIKPCVVAAKLN